MRIPMNSGAFGSDLGRQDPMFSKWEALCGGWRYVALGYGRARKPGSRTLLRIRISALVSWVTRWDSRLTINLS